MARSGYQQRRRQRLAERDGARCHYCRRSLCIHVPVCPFARHAELEHVVPRARGGSEDMSNLVLACWDCNNAKGTRSYEDFVSASEGQRCLG